MTQTKFKFRVLDTFMSRYNVGDRIMSERKMVFETGFGRGAIREYMFYLWSKGVISNEQGKNRHVMRDIYAGEEHF